MASRAGDPRSVWEKRGVVPASRLRRTAVAPALGPRQRAEAFRAACEELGGIYLVFARFLSGRADLLPFIFLRELHSVPLSSLCPDAPGKELEKDPRFSSVTFLSSHPFSENFLVRYEGKPVILEVFSEEGLSRDRWRSFVKGVEPLENSPEARIVSCAVLEDFRRWLDLWADSARKRSMMVHLQTHSFKGLVRMPELVESLSQSESWLAYRDPAPERSSEVPDDAVSLAVEGLLEQNLLLGVVGADLRPEEILFFPDGTQSPRVWPALCPVPVQQHQSLVQYMAATASEESARTVRVLVKLARAEGKLITDADLWKELSGLRFEIDAENLYPQTVGFLLDHWRALSATGARLPLFADLFHRQFSLLLAGKSTEVDPLAVSAWPALFRLVRFRMGESMEPSRLREWGVGSSLAVLGLMRQMSLLLEQVRENDLSVTVSMESEEERAPRSGMGWKGGAALISLMLLLLILSIHPAENSAGTALSLLSLVAGSIFVAAVVRLK